MSHFLQSPTWQKYQELEGHPTFFLQKSNFSALATLHSTPFGNYLLLPYGPNLASKSALKPALSTLRRLAQQKNAFFLRIEPTLPLTATELRHAAYATKFKLQKSHDLDPAHTWVLDLTPSETDLLQHMEARKVRYWRNFSKKGLRLRITQNPDDITILTTLLQKLGEVDNFTPQDQNHLKNQLKSGFATLYILDLELPSPNSDSSKPHTKPIAAALIYDYADTRFYAHAAADFAHRNLAAGSILLIQMILDAKAAGLKKYDFWGITTSIDPKHPWYGFTQYKKSFGGYQVDYSGTYDLILHPHKYRLYQIFRRLNRLARRFFR